jgi:hypothetical protein
MQRDSEFNCAQIGGEMSASPGNGLDDKVAQLGCKPVELCARQFAQI